MSSYKEPNIPNDLPKNTKLKLICFFLNKTVANYNIIIHLVSLPFLVYWCDMSLSPVLRDSSRLQWFLEDCTKYRCNVAGQLFQYSRL